MADAHFSGGTLDDVMRAAIQGIQAHGSRIHPAKGPATELVGVLLEITNPRARLSRTETRGKTFSCLGELCWYLAKRNDLDFISYYLPAYKKFADDGIIFGGYGPRLFQWRGLDQVANVINLLRTRTDSRKGVIQLFDANDIVREHKDVPCTCTLQFMTRDGRLHMFTNMRSNDLFLGLPHDVFCFTMLQELIARSLSVELGSYKHAVGSLHLYDESANGAQDFLAEGWQSTTPMPPMPRGDPWPSVADLLEAESSIRRTGSLETYRLSQLDAYWADLIRLLKVFRCKKDRDADTIETLRATMSSNVYFPFIDKVLSELK
jgi:thymidylate synthase